MKALYLVWSVMFLAVQLVFIDYMGLDPVESFVLFVCGMGFGVATFALTASVF